LFNDEVGKNRVTVYVRAILVQNVANIMMAARLPTARQSYLGECIENLRLQSSHPFHVSNRDRHIDPYLNGYRSVDTAERECCSASVISLHSELLCWASRTDTCVNYFQFYAKAGRLFSAWPWIHGIAVGVETVAFRSSSVRVCRG
jgi:hypothetical protein